MFKSSAFLNKLGHWSGPTLLPFYLQILKSPFGSNRLILFWGGFVRCVWMRRGKRCRCGSPLHRSSSQSCTRRVFSAPFPTKTTWRPSPIATWCTPFRLLHSAATGAPPLHTQVVTSAGASCPLQGSCTCFVLFILSALESLVSQFSCHDDDYFHSLNFVALLHSHLLLAGCWASWFGAQRCSSEVDSGFHQHLFVCAECRMRLEVRTFISALRPELVILSMPVLACRSKDNLKYRSLFQVQTNSCLQILFAFFHVGKFHHVHFSLDHMCFWLPGAEFNLMTFLGLKAFSSGYHRISFLSFCYFEPQALVEGSHQSQTLMWNGALAHNTTHTHTHP